MAEAAALTVAMPVIQQAGVQAGRVREFAVARFKESFGVFDVEKVFWQVVYIDGLIVIFKVVYEVYKALALFLSDPLGSIGRGLLGIGGAVYAFWDNLFFDIFPDLPQPTKEELEQFRKEQLDSIGIPLFLDKVMNEYFLYLLIAGIVIPLLMEYKRVKRVKLELSRI